jgi:hypothetical protein
MRSCGTFLLLSGLVALPVVAAQEIIDRVVARVEGDVILLSEVRALSKYQQLVDGKAESDAQILDRLIDQWIVRNEADAARFPHPSEVEISRGIERVQSAFASAEEYLERRRQYGLSEADIRSMVAAQLYLTDYLDSRFRPSAQVGPKQIDEFYETAVVARAKTRNQKPPSLEASREYIQQALVQRNINEQAERWLTENRARLHVEKFLNEGPK